MGVGVWGRGGTGGDSSRGGVGIRIKINIKITVVCFLNITSSFNRNLSELLDRFVTDFKSLGIPQVEGDGSNVILPSAGELFVFYKKCLVQCSQLSTGPPLLSLSATFQKYLKEYATRVLSANMPK